MHAVDCADSRVTAFLSPIHHPKTTIMKTIIVLFILLVTVSLRPCEAQTFNELFRQKKTQEKYLVRQIAALQGYLHLLHEGYHNLRQGLQWIGQLQTTRGRLHSSWFARLVQQPEDRQSAAAFALLQRLRQQAEQVLQKAKKAGLSPPQWAAFMRQLLHLIKENKKDARELWLLTMDGTLRMEASDRLRLIDGVYQQIKSRYDRFYRSVTAMHRFSRTQLHNRQALSTLKKHYASPGS